MSLRRYAHNHNTSTSTSSPRPSSSSGTPGSQPTTPVRAPTTPRTQIVYSKSPVTSASLSASLPFDWEAARSRGPPPYSTPIANKRIRGLRQSDVGTPTPGSPGLGTPSVRKRERVVRKKNPIERITSLPSMISFEMSQFPNNIPRPAPATSAWILGGLAHLLHFYVRISRIGQVPESDLGWEDMYREGENKPWFDWTVPVTFLLFTAAISNALYLFTRTRLYTLHLASDPVSSPHATFVARPRVMATPSDDEPTQRPDGFLPLLRSIIVHLWRGFMVSARFLLDLSPPKGREKQIRPGVPIERVQELEVWTPGELESSLFAVYSPVHALLWTAFTSANWMLILCIMAAVGAQLRALTRAYEALLKDKAIIAAEVMHEYDEKFVYPRVNPIRKDAAVMTHQAEVVNIWED